MRGDNGTARTSMTTTAWNVVEYGAGTVTPAVNFTVNVSNGGGVSPALEYFEFVSCSLFQYCVQEKRTPRILKTFDKTPRTCSRRQSDEYHRTVEMNSLRIGTTRVHGRVHSPVDTGVQNDTSIYGPCLRRRFTLTTRVHGP